MADAKPAEGGQQAAAAPLTAAAGSGSGELGHQKGKSPWLHAWHDPVAALNAYTPCVRLADINGDGDSKLLVADCDRKLKIYKGTSLISENILLDTPVSICTFYSAETKRPRAPAVAVASGPYVFIYRNLRPYYKFSLPSLDINPQENDIWTELRNDKMDVVQARDALTQARDSGVQLCSRSLDLLNLEDTAAAQEFVAANKNLPLIQQTVITCMEVIKKNMEEEDAQSSLVIGTESRHIMILDPVGSSILTKVELQSAPVFMAVTGLYDVEYRIVCACRDGNIYTVKNGEVTGTVIELEAQPCGLVRIDKSILVGCMGNVVHSFHIKGKKNYSIYLPAPITNLELLSLQKTRNVKALLVSLANGEVRLYNEKHLVTTLQMDDVVTALRFGAYALEESALVAVTKSGSLTIKMLQRQANLDVSSNPPGPPPEQDIPLNIPKKTKLYVEQTQRERDQATEMHRIFQRDLCKLRLSTARAYVKIITDGQGPLSYTAGSSLRLTAQVQGLGPLFKIKLSIQNTGTKPIFDITVTFGYSAMLYKMKTNMLQVPLLVPGLLYRVDADVECVDENGAADCIRVFVCNPKSVVPIISAIVNMPVSEVLLQQ